MGVVQIIVRGLLVVIWLYTNFSLEVKRYWREYNTTCIDFYYPDKPVTNVQLKINFFVNIKNIKNTDKI